MFETGLIVMELITHGRGDRILIVAPAALQDQWADEMGDKFDIDLVILDSDYLTKPVMTIPPWLWPRRTTCCKCYSRL